MTKTIKLKEESLTNWICDGFIDFYWNFHISDWNRQHKS